MSCQRGNKTLRMSTLLLSFYEYMNFFISHVIVNQISILFRWNGLFTCGTLLSWTEQLATTFQHKCLWLRKNMHWNCVHSELFEEDQLGCRWWNSIYSEKFISKWNYCSTLETSSGCAVQLRRFNCVVWRSRLIIPRIQLLGKFWNVLLHHSHNRQFFAIKT